MHATLQLALLAALVLVWIIIDRVKQRKRERVRTAHERKRSGKESS